MRPGAWKLALPAALAAAIVVSCDRGRQPGVAEEAAAAAGRGLDRATRERTLNRLENLRTALARYAADHDGSYPRGSSLDGIASELTPLYLTRVESEDAWGAAMSYSSDGGTYTIRSPGPDGSSGTGDDLLLQDGAITDPGRDGS